jgi:hypothetical protein
MVRLGVGTTGKFKPLSTDLARVAISAFHLRRQERIAKANPPNHGSSQGKLNAAFARWCAFTIEIAVRRNELIGAASEKLDESGVAQPLKHLPHFRSNVLVAREEIVQHVLPPVQIVKIEVGIPSGVHDIQDLLRYRLLPRPKRHSGLPNVDESSLAPGGFGIRALIAPGTGLNNKGSVRAPRTP